MKLRNVSAGIVLCLTMVSCIQDEALNVEAAIDGCSGTNIQLSTINPSSKTASIYVSKSTDLSALEIKFTLPDGASIEPVNAIANDAPPKYDFSTSQIPITPEQTLEQYQRKFRVTSESETTEAVYTITVIKSELPTNFHFENLVDGSPITMNFMNLISNKEKRSNGRVEIRASNLPVWQSPPLITQLYKLKVI